MRPNKVAACPITNNGGDLTGEIAVHLNDTRDHTGVRVRLDYARARDLARQLQHGLRVIDRHRGVQNER